MNATGFWWILLAIALYGALHSLLASNRVKRAAAKAWGERAYRRYYRLLFSVTGAITLLPALALIALFPDQTIYAIPTPWRWLTLALQAAALVGLAVGVLQTGALSFVGLRQLFEPDAPTARFGTEKLVVTGLYRWVRHPLYTCSLILLWLMPVMTWNLLAFNLGVTVYLLVGAYFLEEPKLIEQFGPAYEEYRRKTPMILPGLKIGPF